MIHIQVAERYLKQSRNGISRDAATILDALKIEPNYQISKIELSRWSGKFKFLRMLKMIVSGQPTRFKTKANLSLIPQLDAMLPIKGERALIRLHDIFPMTNPGWFRRISAMSFRKTLLVAVKEKHFFLCNSNYTLSQLHKYFPDANAMVLYCNPTIPDTIACNKCQACNSEYHLNSNYYLAIGTLEPRKNYENLLLAWEKVESVQNINLIIVGKYGWKLSKLRRLSTRKISNFYYFEDVCDFQIEKLTMNCIAFLSASFDEGFDFPALDAALLNKPLLLSDIPVHREIYGNSLTYFDANSPDSISYYLDNQLFSTPIINRDILMKPNEWIENLDKAILLAIRRNGTK